MDSRDDIVWITASGDTMTVEGKTYEARFIVVRDGAKARCYGALTIGGAEEQVIVELESFAPDSRDHHNFRAYSQFLGYEPW